MENPIEPCDICGDIGVKDFIMTCFNCREAREHIYCARFCFRSVPDMWLCQVCRSSTRVLHISELVDNNTRALGTSNAADSHALRPVISSKLSGKSSDNSVKEEISMPTLNGGSRLHPPPHGLMLLAHSCPDNDSLVSNDTSPSKNQRSQFLAFPSPKRKRRTLRLPEEDAEETNRQRPQRSHPCVFHQIN